MSPSCIYSAGVADRQYSPLSLQVEVLKPRLKDAKLDKRLLKEILVRLIYVEMLGHDASWGHVKALQACSNQNLVTKKVAPPFTYRNLFKVLLM